MKLFLRRKKKLKSKRVIKIVKKFVSSSNPLSYLSLKSEIPSDKKGNPQRSLAIKW